jgi:hypothetical protein
MRERPLPGSVVGFYRYSVVSADTAHMLQRGRDPHGRVLVRGVVGQDRLQRDHTLVNLRQLDVVVVSLRVELQR